MPAVRAARTLVLFGLFAAVFHFFAELAHDFRDLPQPVVNLPVEGALRISSIFLPQAGIHSRKNLKPFVNALDGPDVEFTLGDCIHHFLVEHQVANVLVRNHYALFAGEPFGFADVEKALYLVVHTTDRLDLALLAYRSGYGDTLLQRHLAYRADKDIVFRAGGAVSVYHSVALLKAQRGREGYGLIVGKPLPEKAAQNHEAFRVRGAAHFRFTVDRHHSLAPDRNGGCDPVRLAKNVISRHQHRKAVNLPDLFTFGFDPEDILFDYFLYALFDKIGAIDTLFYRLIDVLSLDHFAAVKAGKVITFPQQVCDGAKLEGEFFPVLGKLDAVFQDSGHRPSCPNA